MHRMHLLKSWLFEVSVRGHSDVLGHTAPDLFEKVTVMVSESNGNGVGE
jgi:hypothetical protein